MKCAFIIFLIVLCLSCSQGPIPPGQPQGFIQIKGSDTLVNVAQILAEEFMKEYPYIYVAVTGGGSGVGIASLLNETCDIATASRKIKKKEIDMGQKMRVEPKEFTVAYDGVALIVNNNNPVEKLTTQQLHKIYTGKITNWRQVGGEDLGIVVLSRGVSSGTHTYFKEEVVKLRDKKSKEEFSPGVLLLSSSQAIVEEVAGNKAAVGYLGMGYVSERTKSLKIARDENYYYPNEKNVLSDKYPLSRPLYIYSNGEPEGVVKIFIDFIFSKKGQEQFQKTGFVPLGAKDDKEN